MWYSNQANNIIFSGTAVKCASNDVLVVIIIMIHERWCPLFFQKTERQPTPIKLRLLNHHEYYIWSIRYAYINTYTYQRSHENINSRHTFMCYTFIASLPLPIIHTNDPISDQRQKRIDFFIRKYKNTNFLYTVVNIQFAHKHACMWQKIIKESVAGFLCVSFFADFIFRTNLISFLFQQKFICLDWIVGYMAMHFLQQKSGEDK